MRARVNHRVTHVVVWQVGVVGMAIERELKNAHPGQVELVPQRVDIRCDHSQVFGDERQSAQLLLNRQE